MAFFHTWKWILLFITCLSFLYSEVSANINLTVSPIKYELEVDPGETITRTAKLINLSENTYTIETGTADFIAKDISGTPAFVRKQIGTQGEMSTWISINTPSFVITPKETKEISFDITVPQNATPGWHYWAVFFKNNNIWAAGWQIGLSVDYGVLVLVKVSWEIIIKPEIKDPIIQNSHSWWGGGWWWGGASSSDESSNSNSDTNTTSWSNGKIVLKELEDKCYLDLTASKYDNKCIDIGGETQTVDLPKEDLKDLLSTGSTVNQEPVDNIQTVDNKSNIDSLFENEFNVIFTLPFENQGNTHLKPTWKITLVDEDGKIIKNVWKEIVQNEHGLVIWEKIVDYIPINDVKGNVLPDTKRDFVSNWLWFPYESYDIEGKKVIKYWSPQEFYTANNIESNHVLMPWERVNERISSKKIEAQFELTYAEDLWEPREFSSAQEFDILYKEQYIGINPYAILWTGGFGFILLLFWIIGIMRKKKCVNKKCRKKLKKDMKICPYCGTEQKEKKKKKTHKKK